MAVERFIDYMQFSVNLDSTRFFDAPTYSPINPIANYKRGYRDKWGIRYYDGNVRGGVLVIASGETMENLRSLRNDFEILTWALEAGAKFSRLDLAVTNWQTMDGMIFVQDVEEWARQDLIESSLLAGGVHEVVRPLGKTELQRETLYIGDPKKRAKKGIFRAYDKGIELNIGAYLGTRLELELKREKAHRAACRIAQSNDIAGNFRAYFNVRHKDFDRLMDADAVSTKRGKAQEKMSEKEENDRRWTWLINQVAPALKEAIANDRSLRNDDARLKMFLTRAGILQEEIDFAHQLADRLYRRKLIDNGLK